MLGFQTKWIMTHMGSYYHAVICFSMILPILLDFYWPYCVSSFFDIQEDEIIVSRAFGQEDAVDVTDNAVEFHLAGLIGRKIGSPRCKTMYSRCVLTPQKLMEDIRKVAFAKKN